VNVGRPLFSQIMDFVPWTSFERLVTKYGGDTRAELARKLGMSLRTLYRRLAGANAAIKV